ncbi:MAG: hypothetical protein Q4G59_05885, partial [Planctomycetia bacterium]|nr:hypothetical protein [Planctomycetia bacterium]
ADPHKLARHDKYDKVLSLYRIAPDRRKEAATLLGRYMPQDAYVNAVRFILGEKDKDALDSISSPWRTACEFDLEFRSGGHDFEKDRLPLTTPKIEHEPVLESDQWSLPTRLAVNPYTRSHYENRWVQGYFMWRVNLLPTCRDYFYQTAIHHLVEDIDYDAGYTAPEGFLAPLLDSRMPMPNVAVELLVLALAVKQDNVGALAQDIVLTALADGRLDADALAAACRFWLTTVVPVADDIVIGIPKCIRWVKRFETIAAASDQAAETVRIILQTIVPLAPKKDLGAFCEFLCELCLTQNKQVEDESCHKFLSEIKGTGKAAKLAKQLLAIGQ